MQTEYQRHKQRIPAMMAARAIRDDLPRVERDPCSYCGVRADVGCRHRR